jgi:uncharacterized membrane protein YfcA
MEFPVSGITINPVFLAGVGFLVGVLGGFFGVGGGFIAGPLLLILGVPANFVVGTDLAHMTGKPIVAARRHRSLGHIDIKLGAIMVLGTLVGVELGARLVEALEAAGTVDIVLKTTYVIILLIISAFTAWESIRALRMTRSEKLEVKEVLGFQGLSSRTQGIRIPPFVSLPDSGIGSISIWPIVLVGLITGVLAGSLGVGGGFIRMPLLVYVLGIPTHVAIGTDLFEIVISAGYGTITHALKGNVDVMMALVMHTGAALGAQIGAVSTRFFVGPRIRLIFSALPLIGAVLVLLELFGWIGGGVMGGH